MPTINVSVGFRSKPVPAQHPWPSDCYLQGGEDGIVLEEGALNAALSQPDKALEAVSAALGNPTELKHYRTAFVEAFPKNPATFIRGEGKDLVEAENAAWRQWQRVSGCPNHEFERRNYRNGAGFCIHCGLFKSKAFEPLDRCVVCDLPTCDSVDKKGRWYCTKHISHTPEADRTEAQHYMLAREKGDDL